MSHFCVLVITNKRPVFSADEEGPPGIPRDKNVCDLAEVLQPWHEYECTGTRDKYVVWVDKTDELMAEWNSKTEARYIAEEDARPEPVMYDGYEKRFYRDPEPDEKEKIGPIAGSGGGHGLSWSSKDWGDGKGYRTKIHIDPTTIGYRKIEVPVSKLYDSLQTYAEEYHGWRPIPKVMPTRYGDLTNPNARWDWWVVGGRYRGYLRLKPGSPRTLGELSTFEQLDGPNPVGEFRSDQAQMKDIDLAGWRDELGRKAAQRWDKVHEIIAGRKLLTFKQVLAKHGLVNHESPGYSDKIQAVRDAYWKQPAMKALQDYDRAQSKKRKNPNEVQIDIIFDGPDEYLEGAREEYVEKNRGYALRPFAIVKDGNWYEKGKMGWWAAVFDEKDEDVWRKEVQKMFDELSPEAWLTVVDCHI